MNFIVLVHPDGEVHKLPQDDPLYLHLMPQIRAAAPTFTPFTDDEGLGRVFYAVGSHGSLLFQNHSTTTTTTTTS